MAIQGSEIVGAMLVAGAGYYVLTVLLPQMRKQVLSHLVKEEELLNGLSVLFSMSILVIVGQALVSNLSSAFDGDARMYISALSDPLNVATSSLGYFWTAVTVSAYVFIGFSVLSLVKKGKE